jgi:hypothetical protein
MLILELGFRHSDQSAINSGDGTVLRLMDEKTRIIDDETRVGESSGK